MYLNSLLDRHAILGNVSVNSKRQALQRLRIPPPASCNSKPTLFCRLCWKREKLGSTGVGLGVAVPHAALAGLDRMYGIFVRLEKPRRLRFDR
ncbi:MAG: PTS sugar transporter subunit IIA [Asticcacaulis sp.]